MMRFRQRNRGQTLIMVGLGATIFCAFLAFVIDWGQLINARQKLHNDCDASALAAAENLPSDSDAAPAKATATTYFANNVMPGQTPNIQWQSNNGNQSYYKVGANLEYDVYVTTPYNDAKLTAAGVPPGNAIEVKACRMIHYHIGSLFGVPQARVCARSVAVRNSAPRGMVILDKMTLTGNASLTVGTAFQPGVLVVDYESSSGTAATLSGSAQVTANRVLIDNSGTYSTSGSAKFVDYSNNNLTPLTGQPMIGDPLASLPVPSSGGMNSYGAQSFGGNSTGTLQPGIYTGAISIGGSASVTMQPGTYILQGGLSISGSGSLTDNGLGVMIYNESGSLSFTGTANVSLSPPTSGTYQGITVFQARNNNSAVSMSGNPLNLNGSYYFPAPDTILSLSGNSTLSNAMVVCWQLSMSGSASATINPQEPPSATGVGVSLAE